MSEGRFWTRSQAGHEQNEPPEALPVRTWLLTAADRCDRCGAQAYVKVLLPRRRELLFCAHHNRQHASALAKIAVGIHDETGRLAHVAA